MPRRSCERASTEVNAASVIYVIIYSTKTSENHSLGRCLNVALVLLGVKDISFKTCIY